MFARALCVPVSAPVSADGSASEVVPMDVSVLPELLDRFFDCLVQTAETAGLFACFPI
jgi:hypothetical protein